MKNTFILLFILLISCSPKEVEKEVHKISADGTQITLNDLQMKNAGIVVAQPNLENIAGTFRVQGSIGVPPQGTASVSAPSGGYVRKSSYMPGNKVAKGQVLALLEDPEIVQLQQDYLLAKSNLSYAQKDFSRQKDLNQSQASSDKVMQKAQNEAQNQQILKKGLAEKLRAIGINPEQLTANTITKTVAVRSPISGYISSVNIHLGQYVSPNEKLFEIVNTQDTHLILKVFENDLGNLQLGQHVFAFTNENPTKKYQAKIILISKDFSADRSVLVHCHFNQYAPELIPGTFMNADVEIDRKSSTALPEDAVVTWENHQYVFEEIRPKTFKMTKITIGNTENGYTQILGNHDIMNKKIATKGAYQLLMALKNIED